MSFVAGNLGQEPATDHRPRRRYDGIEVPAEDRRPPWQMMTLSLQALTRELYGRMAKLTRTNALVVVEPVFRTGNGPVSVGIISAESGIICI